jgi:hypothetical protein
MTNDGRTSGGSWYRPAASLPEVPAAFIGYDPATGDYRMFVADRPALLGSLEPNEDGDYVLRPTPPTREALRAVRIGGDVRVYERTT